MKRIAQAVAGMLVAVAAATVDAQGATGRGLRIVVPAPPGGGTDGLARLIAEGLSTTMKQQVVVDNRPGAGGVIGSDLVAKAAPDGATMLMVVTGHAINPALVAKLPFDTLKDFAGVTHIAASPLIVVGGAHTGARTIADLTDLARRDRSALTFAHFEASSRLATELFRQASGLPLTPVPYKGTAQAMTDLVGGHVGFSFTTIPPVVQHHRAGKLAILGVAARARSMLLPDIPTVEEQGVRSMDASVWYGFVVPAGTPLDVRTRLQEGVATVVGAPAARDRLRAWGMDPVLAAPQAFDAFLQAQVELWGRVAREAGIAPE